MSKIRVEKTSNLNGRKLWRVSRQFMVAPIVVRDLQRGLVEELDEHVAKVMIAQGLVKRVEEKPELKKETNDNKPKSKKAETAIKAIGEVDDAKTVVDEPDSSPVDGDDNFCSTEDDKDEDEDLLSRKESEL